MVGRRFWWGVARRPFAKLDFRPSPGILQFREKSQRGASWRKWMSGSIPQKLESIASLRVLHLDSRSLHLVNNRLDTQLPPLLFSRRVAWRKRPGAAARTNPTKPIAVPTVSAGSWTKPKQAWSNQPSLAETHPALAKLGIGSGDGAGLASVLTAP